MAALSRATLRNAPIPDQAPAGRATTKRRMRRGLPRTAAATFLAALLLATVPPTHAETGTTEPPFDVVIRSGLIHDGNGGAPYVADLAIRGDRIAAIGGIDADRARRTIDATGFAVAPGFVNMLSWGAEPLLADGRAQSDIRQGVTLEVFGEGTSMGPLSDAMKQNRAAGQDDPSAGIPWTTLGEYLDFLARRGISPNVASFVGATTVRVHELGTADRAPTESELANMRRLVSEAMQEGALGVSSALIYAPGLFARTDELAALARVAADYDGMYISHLRSEGNRLLESIDELLTIAEASGARAEIYHLKAAGANNWRKFEEAVARIEAARTRGLRVTANMYTYPAALTGLYAALPPWVRTGGYYAAVDRLRDPDTRARAKRDMTTQTNAWENLLLAAGPEAVLLVGFSDPRLRPYLGKTLTEVAALRDQDPFDAAIDLILQDGRAVKAIYFLMSEENVTRGVALPWVSFGSDARPMVGEGPFEGVSTHPRAYGNFARVLGKYVREEHVLSLPAAIRKLTRLPATNLRLRDRGELKIGYHADVVVFDPARVADRATFADPFRYAAGVVHVLVNGEAVLLHGAHTGALPGRVVRGPGWTGWSQN